MPAVRWLKVGARPLGFCCLISPHEHANARGGLQEACLIARAASSGLQTRQQLLLRVPVLSKRHTAEQLQACIRDPWSWDARAARPTLRRAARACSAATPSCTHSMPACTAALQQQGCARLGGIWVATQMHAGAGLARRRDRTVRVARLSHNTMAQAHCAHPVGKCKPRVHEGCLGLGC